MKTRLQFDNVQIATTLSREYVVVVNFNLQEGGFLPNQWTTTHHEQMFYEGSFGDEEIYQDLTEDIQKAEFYKHYEKAVRVANIIKDGLTAKMKRSTIISFDDI